MTVGLLLYLLLCEGKTVMCKQLLAWTALFSIMLSAGSANAGIVSFDDLPLGTTRNVGGSLTSDGVTFDMQTYLWPSGTPTNAGQADIITPWSPVTFGTGQVLYPENINALIDLAGTVGRQTFVTIPFYEGGGNVNLHVNPAMGGSIINANDFTDPAINGATINGVSINVLGTSQQGFIELTGPVDQVLIGGQEAIIDNIRYSPEPGSAMICGLGLAWLVRRQSR